MPGLVMRERPEGCIAEPIRFHGPNVVRCEIISGAHMNPLIREYLSIPTIDRLLYPEEELNLFPGKCSIIMGDLNVDTGILQNPRSQQVAYFLASFGLVGLLAHFRQRLRFHHMQIWWQFLQGK